MRRIEDSPPPRDAGEGREATRAADSHRKAGPFSFPLPDNSLELTTTLLRTRRRAVGSTGKKPWYIFKENILRIFTGKQYNARR